MVAPLAPSPAPEPGPLLALRHVSRAYRRGPVEVTALREVTLEIPEGESLAVSGPSGSGKSTLLSLLGCLDRPTSGEVLLAGLLVSRLPDQPLSLVRNRTIGFVFQSFHLIPQLTVAENVETPLLYGDVPSSEWPARVARCLDKVGLGHRSQHRPSELSGGEAQRVAVARALVTEPRVLLADEPTGNLDTRTGQEIADVLFELHGEGVTLVLVTHDDGLAGRAERRVRLRDGAIVDDAGA